MFVVVVAHLLLYLLTYLTPCGVDFDDFLQVKA